MGKADRAADDVDETEDDGDDGESSDKFDKMLEALTGEKTSKSGADPMAMMMMMMMEQKREAREQNASQMKMILSILPMLIGNKGPDPMMMEILKSSLNGNQQEKFAQSMMQIQTAQASANMEMLKSTLENTNKMKDEMTTRQMDMMEARLEKNDAPAVSPMTEVIRELRLAVEPIVLAKMGANATAAAAAAKRTESVHSNPAAHIEAPKDVVPMVLRILQGYHEKKDHLGAFEKRGIRAKLATVILDAPTLAKAICNEDMDAVTEICKPYVLADEQVMAWIIQPPISAWLSDYLINQIAPVLDSMMEAEEKESGTFVDTVEDAEGDSEGDEGDGDNDGHEPEVLKPVVDKQNASHNASQKAKG